MEGIVVEVLEMANEEQLERLLRSVEEWNEWRKENSDVWVDLSDADLSNANLRNVDLSNINLINIITLPFNSADLRNADLSNANLRNANLRNANLKNANLSYTDLSNANLRNANLRKANLRNANLSRIQVLKTNFEGATLTGACIEDWNINSKTNLAGVICEDIYLKYQFLDYTDRRPADPSQTFAPGDFARLVQKSLDTVDLIFRNGIDWQAFSNSFQALKTEQVKVEGSDRAFSVRAIENLDDGSFVVRINTPKDADKAEIERSFQVKYKAELKRLKGTYRKELNAKDKEIEIYRQQSADMMEIVKLQATRTINVEVTAVADQSQSDRTINIKNNQIKGSGYTEGNTTVNVNQSQNLASAAKEIQDLLEQLSETYPTTTLSEKSAVAEKAIARIKSDENWLGKVVGIIKAMGKEAFFEAIDHPAANVLRAGFEELLSD